MPDKPHLEEVEEQAALYALGALESGDAQRFRQRVASDCPVCRGSLRDYQTTVAALSMAAPEADPPAHLRARLLERVAPKPKTRRPMAGMLVRAGETGWEPSPSMPGVEIRPLHGQETMLIRMAPKSWFPAHEHVAAEQCLILEGSISSHGTTAYAGDYLYMPAGTSHPPLYSETGCVMLIAYT